MNEMNLTLRMNLLGGMNSFINEIGDEDYTAWWLNHFPDEATEDDLKEIAEEGDLFADICQTFGEIVTEAWHHCLID